ncbi:MAG TPA: urea carboxylase-associated family protein [Candidatus Saccharimonadales bacterium]|nr:urea carboxylase-associated family protein [Candidatus Saccharimonadales bacterium]
MPSITTPSYYIPTGISLGGGSAIATTTVGAELLIPGGQGAALTVSRGQLLEIVDVEGQQVADFVAFAAGGDTEWLSTTHTRSATMRLDLRVGDILQSNWRTPMFELLHDDVGTHDVITSMCDARRYLLDYGVTDHRSCRTNLTQALEPWRISEERIPDPFNFFQNAPILPDRSFGNQLPIGRPGDSLTLRVLADAVVGVSACPQDLNPCNGFHPSPIRLRVQDPNS